MAFPHPDLLLGSAVALISALSCVTGMWEYFHLCSLLAVQSLLTWLLTPAITEHLRFSNQTF